MYARSFPDEVKWALGRLDAKDIGTWGMALVGRVPGLIGRRITGLWKTLKSVGDFAINESCSAIKAAKDKKFLDHLRQRGQKSWEAASGAAATSWKLAKLARSNPKQFASDALPVALGFAIGSGGLDGNGGAPDLDIAALGIGGHRSILFHSIIAGVVIELLLLSLVDFAKIVCEKLPENERSPVWGKILENAESLCLKAGIGASLGIAYHLGVDGLVQPAPYHGLPFSMPMEAHQAIFVTNAIAEASDAAKRQGRLTMDVIETLMKQVELLDRGREQQERQARHREILAKLKVRRLVEGC
jgi:hypothetical protein